MVKKPKRGGRPPKGGQGRIAPLSLRIEPELREALNQATTEHGGSLTDEVQRRLRISFKLFDAFGGEQNYAVCRCIANLMIELTSLSGKSWATDPWVFDQLRRGVLTILERWDPVHPDPDERQGREKPAAAYGVMKELPDALGETLAAQQLAKLAFTPVNPASDDPLARIKIGLGKLTA